MKFFTTTHLSTMELKNILLFVFLFVAASGLQGQEKVNHPLSLEGTVMGNSYREVIPTDTLSGIEFATRVDSLFKYWIKEPGSTLDILFKDGIRKPDLQSGDILKVTAEDGSIKYYYLKLNDYKPGTIALLGSITWPDMPQSFKGELAQTYGWKGDTIPSFDSHKMNYELILPNEVREVPALTFSTIDINSNVKVSRAINLEGFPAHRTITFTVTAEDNITKTNYSVLLKKEQDTIDIQHISTVTSGHLKVSNGNSGMETIIGMPMNITVADFYSMITKASQLQTLKVISAFDGAELAGTDFISDRDTLKVISEDQSFVTKYLLIPADALNSDNLLNSSVYSISVTGITGTVSGFPASTSVKTVLEGISIPQGATLTMVDKDDAYKTLVRLNYDTAYVEVQANQDVFFEVFPENRVRSVLYQLVPSTNPTDAFVTSDLYMIDQHHSLIHPLRQGTTVASLFRDLTPAMGATMEVMDKEGFVRSTGAIYKDDRLLVMAENKINMKVYFFSRPSKEGGPYLAYILSDEYEINQVRRFIYDIPNGIGRTDFISQLMCPIGASIKVMNAMGNESTEATLKTGDYLLVASKDGLQSATYGIDYLFDGVEGIDDALTITMSPNPTEGKVFIQGIAKGNSIRVMNLAGMVIFDQIANSSTLTVSLENQAPGVYLVVVLDRNQHLTNQKIVKR